MPDRIGVGRLAGDSRSTRAKAAPTTAPAASVMPEKIEAGSFIMKDSTAKSAQSINGGHRADIQAARRERNPVDSRFP